jgi:hypothetical protein
VNPNFYFRTTLREDDDADVTVKASYSRGDPGGLHCPPDDGDVTIHAVIAANGENVLDFIGDDDVENLRLAGIRHLNKLSRAGAWG